MDRDEIFRILRAFEEVGLEYVLIGATAMGIHGLVRATEDVDLFIRATREDVERLKQAFRTTYADDPNVDNIHADELLGDYPALRYYPPSGDLYFDVMTRLGGAASFDTVEAEIEGIRVSVASPMALYQLKKSTVRPLDRRDAEPSVRRGARDGPCFSRPRARGARVEARALRANLRRAPTLPAHLVTGSVGKTKRTFTNSHRGHRRVAAQPHSGIG
ncbi:MAG: hypothetical protein E2P02_00370 [Acidobacteria bacterium]|nr:MAG: hypothetical protein E2P02_00370 [Acidobacteriota bacterium]